MEFNRVREAYRNNIIVKLQDNSAVLSAIWDTCLFWALFCCDNLYMPIGPIQICRLHEDCLFYNTSDHELWSICFTCSRACLTQCILIYWPNIGICDILIWGKNIKSVIMGNCLWMESRTVHINNECCVIMCIPVTLCAMYSKISVAVYLICGIKMCVCKKL